MEDYIAQVHGAKKKKTILWIAGAAICILLLVFIFTGGKGNTRVLTESDALSKAPALALTDSELALAQTILDQEIFRNALSYDLVDNTTAFTWEETEAIVGDVIPQGAQIGQIAVSGAVVIID